MNKRLLDYSPATLVDLTKKQFLDGIRAAEGRTVAAYSCPYAPPYVEKVSNPELAAAFGADYIILEGLNPKKLQIPGIPSKNTVDDQPYKKQLQVEMGFGFTAREIKKLIGRPLGIILLVPEYLEDDFGHVYADTVFSQEMVEFLLHEGYAYLSLRFDQKSLLAAVEKTVQIAGKQAVIEAGIPHGPGIIRDAKWPPNNLRELVTPDYVAELALAGANIIDIPAVGIVPGYTQEYVTQLATSVHNAGALVGAAIAHSVEGSDENTIRQIALANKICGADIFNIAAGGVYESVALPEILFALSVAVKGRRHTYRRMAQSVLR